MVRTKIMVNFNRLNLDQLLALFNDNFYKVITNKSEFYDYLKAISCRICDCYRTKNYPYFILDTMEKGTMGMMMENRVISLNFKLINAFPHYASLNNLYYPFVFISTMIHETRHFLQENSFQDIDPIVKSYNTYRTCLPRSAKDCISYGTEPIEIDARYFAFQVLKDRQFFDKYLFSGERLNYERIFSRQISSIAHSLNEAFNDLKNLNLSSKLSVFDMDKSYSEFLREIGLSKEFFKTKTIKDLPEKSKQDLSFKLDWDSGVRDIMNENYDAMAKADRAQTSELNLILKQSYSSLLKLAQLSDSQKATLGDMLRLRAMSLYETDRLYHRLAPDYYDIVRDEIHKPKLREIEQFNDIYDIIEPV